MDILKFKKGLEENLPKELEKDTFYISTDTKKIRLNDAVWEDNGCLRELIYKNEKVTSSALNVLNDKINTLDDVVNENEKVTSLIANDLNKKLINNETLIDGINNEIINLSNQNDAIKNSINEIDVNVKTNQNTIDELIDIVIENEDVTANAIAKLNKRINSNNELIENVSSNTLEEFERINLKNNENDETIKGLVEASSNRDEYLETLGDELNENERMAALAFNDLNKRNIATNESIKKLKDIVERNEKVTANALNALNDKLPKKISELENDSKFITIDEMPEVTVPTKISELTNDSGFITLNEVERNKHAVYEHEDSQSVILKYNALNIINDDVSFLSIQGFEEYLNAKTTKYTLHFKTASDCTISLPENVIWANGIFPTIEGNCVYELSVVDTVLNNTHYYKAILVPFK